MELIKDSIITFFSRILIRLLGIIPGIIIARALGPEGKGEYALLLLVVYLCYAFFKGGVEDANVYYIANKRYSTEEIVSNSIPIALLLGLSSVGIFSLLFPYIQQLFLQGVNSLFIFIIIWEVPVLVVTRYLQNILLGLGRIVKYNLIEIFSTAVIIIMVPVLILVFKLGVMGAVISSLCSVLLAGVVAMTFVGKYCKMEFKFNPKIIKDLLIYGIKGHLGEIIYVFYTHLDIIMVSYFLGIKFVGFYSIALNVQMIWYIPFAIGIVLFQKVSSSSLEEANRLSSIACRNTFFITTIMAFFCFIGSYYFIPILYGYRFVPSIKPLWMLLPGMVFLSGSKILNSYLFGRGKRMIYTYSCSVAFVINLVLNYLLIPKWGMIGAAFATSFSYFVYMSFMLFQYLKISKNSILETLLVRRADFINYSNFYLKLKRRIAKTY